MALKDTKESSIKSQSLELCTLGKAIKLALTSSDGVRVPAGSWNITV